jgi:ribonuclease T1
MFTSLRSCLSSLFALALLATCTSCEHSSQTPPVRSPPPLVRRDSKPATPKAGVPAYVLSVLAHVRSHHAAMEGYVGGRNFGNYEQVLPKQDTQGRIIRYQEWDVHPKVDGRNRGAERLVTGGDGRAWYTQDHYAHFVEVKE